jgi:transcriptional regulator with XRE-family HTH domain
MLKTPTELMQEIAGRIKARRVAFGWPQQDAAKRAGVTYRTWRRLETKGHASIEHLVKAAVALRCEEGLAGLFPEPAAATLDDLLSRQAAGHTTSPSSRIRARAPKVPHP